MTNHREAAATAMASAPALGLLEAAVAACTQLPAAPADGEAAYLASAAAAQALQALNAREHRGELEAAVRWGWGAGAPPARALFLMVGSHGPACPCLPPRPPHVCNQPFQPPTANDSLPCSAATTWATQLTPQLRRWESALGPQPPAPEKAAIERCWGGEGLAALFGGAAPPPPPPDGCRAAGAATSPANAAARLAAAGALTLVDAALGCLQALQPAAAAAGAAAAGPPAGCSASGAGGEAPAVAAHPLEAAAAVLVQQLEDTGLPYRVRLLSDSHCLAHKAAV